MIDAAVAYTLCDLLDGFIVALQYGFGFCDAEAVQIADGRDTVHGYKGFTEIYGADTALLRQQIIGDFWILIVCGNILNCRKDDGLLIFGDIIGFSGFY